MRINAIETQYKGYRFRSRLEARFAVFLTELNVDFVYEPEGFKLGPDNYYLPDFYLPASETYIEIKPSGALNDEIITASEKLRLLSEQADSNACIVTDGNRNDPRGYFQVPHAYFKGPRDPEMIARLKMLTSIGVFNFPIYVKLDDGNIWVPSVAHFTKLCKPRDGKRCTAPNVLMIPRMRDVDTLLVIHDKSDKPETVVELFNLPDMFRAEMKAKAVRFEHGENNT